MCCFRCAAPKIWGKGRSGSRGTEAARVRSVAETSNMNVNLPERSQRHMWVGNSSESGCESTNVAMAKISENMIASIPANLVQYDNAHRRGAATANTQTV